MRRVLRWIGWVACFAGSHTNALATITWNSDDNAVNLTSAGGVWDGGYQLELGVFADSFVPTPANLSAWAAHWHPAQRCAYHASTQRFAATFTPADNDAPFAAGTAAYVWGFRGDALSGEWILFRAPNWNWPAADPGSPPPPVPWNVKEATAVLGSIHAGGHPSLMRSAAVTNAAPPATSWSQWQGQHLAGEPLDQPDHDPDLDGVGNLLEYVFGSSPKLAGPPPATPVAVVGGHLQITIPRRVDHPALLVVEVSDDLITWQSGAGHTAVVSDGLAALVVRDLVTVDASAPRRFMRLKAQLLAVP